MAFLSSLFQTGAPVPQVAGPAVMTQKLPEELAPFYKDILGKAQALYKEKTAEGYKPYVGPTIAEFSPEQQQAFTGIAGLQGQAKPVFDEAMGLTRGAAAPITGEQITEYMSPYQQAVTDIEKREAQKTYESQVQPQLAAQAAQAQAFGGSRQGILEGMAADTQQRLQADIQAKGSQQAYQEAIRRLEAERTRSGQAGAQLATMAPSALKTQLGEFGALQTIGEEKQQQTQTALDEAFRQYALEQNYPYDTMSKYQSVVTGAPIAPTQFAPPQARTPSIGQQLIGGLGTIAGTYGAFTGKSPMSLFTGKKHGGGLSDLPIIHAQKNSFITDILNKYKGYSQMTGQTDEWGGLRDWEQKKKIRDIEEEKQRMKGLRALANQEGYAVGPMGNVTHAGKRLEGYGDKPSKYETFSWGGEDPYIGTSQLQQTIQREFPERPLLEMDDPYATSYGPEGRVLVKNPLGPGMKEAYTGQVTDADIIGMTSEPPKRPVSPEPPTMPPNLEQPERDLRQEENIRGRIALQKERMTEDEQIAAAQKAYTDQITARDTKLAEREAGLADERTRAQWGNVAKFFARLGTATPRMEGLSGVVDAALREAPESLNAMNAVNKEIRQRKESIQDQREDIKTLQLKEKLGLVLSTTERKRLRKKEDLLQKNTERSLELEKERVDIAKITAEAALIDAGITDEIKAGFYTNVDNYVNDFTKDFSALTGKDGKPLIIKGEIKDKNLKLEIQALKAEAVTLMAKLGSHDAFIKEEGRQWILANMNQILSKYTAPPVKGDNEDDNEEEQTTITVP